MDIYDKMFDEEAYRSERFALNFHWPLYGILFLLAMVKFIAEENIVGFVGMTLLGCCLIYNGVLAAFILKKKNYIWIRYISVTIDTILLTFYNALDTYYNSTLTPVTTATLLIYPVILFLAALRHDRRLIVYSTIITVIAMNILFAAAYPHFDRTISNKLICGDILGQVYRTVYIILIGMLIFSIPRIIERLLKNQKEIFDKSVEHFTLAHHDALTGLANRRLLVDFLDKTIALASRNKNAFAVIFIDLDGFKPVNDTYGHDAGDLLLKEIAQRLSRTVRESDIVARVGGDEFVIVTGEINRDSGAGLIARRIITIITAPVIIEGNSVSVGASIGISIFPSHGNDSESLIQMADQAMYRVKKTGKNSYAHFEP